MGKRFYHIGRLAEATSGRGGGVSLRGRIVNHPGPTGKQAAANMHVFFHHIYEYKKGLRNLILHTARRECCQRMYTKLEKEKINYFVLPVNDERVNIFFGAKECIEVIKAISKDSLSQFSAEEDFLLGIMLGYDRLKQCERYLKKKHAA